MPQPTQNSTARISRRAVLHGAGVAVALPWLESLTAVAEPAPETFPKRFAVMFMGNGINENHWSAEGSGAAMKLGKTLSPLEPLKHKINVIDGLFNKGAVGLGIHPAQTGSLLSGAHLQKGAIIRSGISVDQTIADTVGQDTAQPSIVLACEQPMTGYHETNYSLAYSSHISWQTPDSPVPVEVYPSLAFDNLFENRGSLRLSAFQSLSPTVFEFFRAAKVRSQSSTGRQFHAQNVAQIVDVVRDIIVDGDVHVPADSVEPVVALPGAVDIENRPPFVVPVA